MYPLVNHSHLTTNWETGWSYTQSKTSAKDKMWCISVFKAFRWFFSWLYGEVGLLVGYTKEGIHGQVRGFRFYARGFFVRGF